MRTVSDLDVPASELLRREGYAAPQIDLERYPYLYEGDICEAPPSNYLLHFLRFSSNCAIFAVQEITEHLSLEEDSPQSFRGWLADKQRCLAFGPRAVCTPIEPSVPVFVANSTAADIVIAQASFLYPRGHQVETRWLGPPFAWEDRGAPVCKEIHCGTSQEHKEVLDDDFGVFGDVWAYQTHQGDYPLQTALAIFRAAEALHQYWEGSNDPASFDILNSAAADMAEAKGLAEKRGVLPQLLHLTELPIEPERFLND